LRSPRRAPPSDFGPAEPPPTPVAAPLARHGAATRTAHRSVARPARSAPGTARASTARQMATVPPTATASTRRAAPATAPKASSAATTTAAAAATAASGEPASNAADPIVATSARAGRVTARRAWYANPVTAAAAGTAERGEPASSAVAAVTTTKADITTDGAGEPPGSFDRRTGDRHSLMTRRIRCGAPSTRTAPRRPDLARPEGTQHSRRRWSAGARHAGFCGQAVVGRTFHPCCSVRTLLLFG
jgi:hypothetical protein